MTRLRQVSNAIPRPIKITVAIIAILGGLVTLGVTMPWDALSRAEAAKIYETKESARATDQRMKALKETLDRIEKTQSKMLDILLGR